MLDGANRSVFISPGKSEWISVRRRQIDGEKRKPCVCLGEYACAQTAAPHHVTLSFSEYEKSINLI